MSTVFGLLLEANRQVKEQYDERKSQWVGSPFEWLIRLPSRTVGAAAEALVEKWLEAQGFKLSSSKSRDFDRWCDLKGGSKRLRLEIKFSRLWESENYVFQQIRDQEYDVIFCLGVAPESAHAWVIPKKIAWSNATLQHGGKKGQDTKWIRVSPQEPPDWLKPYGGELKDAVECLRRMLSE